MVTKKQTSKEYFNSISLLYYAMIASQVLFILFSIYFRLNVMLTDELNEFKNIFIFIVPLLAIGGVIGSNYMYKTKLTEAKSKTDLLEIMGTFRAALILRFAILEGSSFFAIAIYFLTGNIMYLGISGLIIGFFFFLKPSRERAAIDLELSVNNTQYINDLDKVIAEITIQN